MEKKSKDTVLTPDARRDMINQKGGVSGMTKESERFTLRLTRELKERLDESRKHMGVSLNALVVQILWDWAEPQRKEAAGNSAVQRRQDELLKEVRG